MSSEKEKEKTLRELIHGYDACGSPIADLLRELEQARKDAKRFAWVFDPANTQHEIWGGYLLTDGATDPLDRVRAAIDAAMEAQDAALTGSET